MGELKPGWKRVKLGQVALNSTAATKDPQADGFDRYVIGKHIPEEGGRITSSNPVGDAEFGSRIRTMVRAGDVVCTTRGPKLKVAVADFDCLSAHTNFILRPKNPAEFLPEILEAVVRSYGFQDHLRKHFRGSTNLFVNWSDAAEYEFALPPLDEQRRIAQRLSAAAAVVLAAECGLRMLDTVESALLREEFGLYTTTSSTRTVALCEVAHIQSGVAKGRVSEPGTTVEAPYLRVANVKDGALDLSQVLRITVERAAIDKYLLRPGDVLMTEGGDLDKLGRGTVWQGEVAGCVHQNHVFAVRPDAAKLDSWYLAALARSPFGRGYFQRCAKRTSNLASVNKRELGALPVPAVGLHQQKRFVEAWVNIRSSQSQLRTRADDGRRLLSAFLANLTEA